MILVVFICCSIFPFGSLFDIANCTLPRAEYDADFWEWWQSLSHTEYASVGNLPIGQVCAISSDRWCGWCWASGLVDCRVALGIPFAVSLICIRFWQRFSCCLSQRLLTLVSFFQMRAISIIFPRRHSLLVSSPFRRSFRFATTAQWLVSIV